MVILLNTLFFLLFVIISQFSIMGYGIPIKKILINHKFINHKHYEMLFEFILGLIFLNLIGFILFFSSISNPFINMIFFLFGFLIYYKNYSPEKKKFEKTIIIIISIMFIGILISKTHEDYLAYHFDYIDLIYNSDFVAGLGNLEIGYNYTPFIAYLQKIFIIPHYNFKLLHIPIFLIFLNICFFLISDVFFKKNINLIFFILLLFIILKFTRLSEFGYDYPAGLLLLVIFIIFDYSIKNNIKLSPILFLIIYLYSVSIKITSLFFLPIIFFIVLKSMNYEKKMKFVINKTTYKRSIFFVCLLTFFILDNFFKSGCLMIIFKASCFNAEMIPWAVDYNKISDYGLHVNLWAKGFYHQNYKISDPFIYLSFSNWFPIWLKEHFFYKVFEFNLLLIFVSLIILILYKNQLNFNLNNKFNHKIFFIFCSLISIIIWISNLPQLRFGFYNIICFYLLLIQLFIKTEIKVEKKKLVNFLIIFSLLFYFSSNLLRIKKEFERNDRYKFVNFPFESVTNYAVVKSFEERYKNTLKFQQKEKKIILYLSNK